MLPCKGLWVFNYNTVMHTLIVLFKHSHEITVENRLWINVFFFFLTANCLYSR